jgi:GT2 family glycosyltransferase
MKGTISIVVITHNRPKDVEDTLTSLENQTVKPDEIILIDNASSPPLKTHPLLTNVKQFRLDRLIGLSQARNHAITACSGEFIAFMDDDAVVDSNWLQEIHAVSDADIRGGPIKPLFQSHPPAWWTESDFGGTVGVGNARYHDFRDCLWGSNLVVRKQLFDKIGVFNTAIGRQKGKLLSGEEVEFVDRAIKADAQIHFVPSATVYHKVPSQRLTFKYIVRWNYYGGKSQKLSGKNSYVQTFAMLSVSAAKTIISSKKTNRIKNLAQFAWYIGKLF